MTEPTNDPSSQGVTDPLGDIRSFLESIVKRRPSLWSISACGLTRLGNEIPALVELDAYIPTATRARVLLISGLNGDATDVEEALGALDMFASGGQKYAGDIALSAIPCGNPDGLLVGKGRGNGSGGDPRTGYPPEEDYYYHPKAPESRYLWRWICFQAPDLVLELVNSTEIRWEANDAARRLAPAVAAKSMWGDGTLLDALGTGNPNGLGQIPGLRLEAPSQRMGPELGRLWSFIPQFAPWEPSPARHTLDSRRSRSRLRIASILDSVYGHELEPVNYTQGVGISGRLRLAELAPTDPGPGPEIAASLEHAGLLGTDPFGEIPSCANLAGVIWGPELAEATGDQRWSDLLVQVAGRYQATPSGTAPPPSDPDFRTEDMFMNGAILGRAFQATGEARYLDMLTQFLLDSDIQQSNGLFWHCRSAPFFWGRGNGFALMGLSETLTYLPEGHPARERILGMCLKLLDALVKLQQPSGMFPNVLDVSGSYQEFTTTCMFGYSVARGIRLGWLDISFIEPLRLAWQGVSERIDEEGNIVDACISTGVQIGTREYLDRPAVFGKDDRSGGMALWFAVELERLSQDSP
jgi:rhamnogalacturonyl hydrolase YesR